MTKEEAHKILCRKILPCLVGEWREAISIGIKSIEAEPHWIPVTERLPEYGEEVLTITQDDVYEVNHVIDDVHDEWFWEDNGNVIAWMPLPEPYKGVTE